MDDDQRAAQEEWERYLRRAGAGERAMRVVFDEIARGLRLEAIVRWLVFLLWRLPMLRISRAYGGVWWWYPICATCHRRHPGDVLTDAREYVSFADCPWKG